jgi:hypothetical protein
LDPQTPVERSGITTSAILACSLNLCFISYRGWGYIPEEFPSDFALMVLRVVLNASRCEFNEMRLLCASRNFVGHRKVDLQATGLNPCATTANSIQAAHFIASTA